MDRRDFLITLGAAGATAAGAGDARASGGRHAPENPYGVLVDTTRCIGCRKCEWACNQSNNLPVQPLAEFEDKSVFAQPRRPDSGHYTVVNQIDEDDGRPAWVKVQCMHCQDPACVSACLVSAFSKNEDGSVRYDSWRCMGCRYCMVSCPFQIPAYEYDNPLDPVVRKCTFCFERLDAGRVPACVEICPVECLTFGRRDELIALAHDRIASHPDRYIDHVYGEHEVGGTSWLYLSDRPFTELGLPELGEIAPPRITEKIQHGIFKHFIPPIAVYAALGQIMWLGRRKNEVAANDEGDEDE